ncbi:hypothetical protein FOL47_010720 [Perkinsus chesapeaki]|uniref:Dynein regulatory complex protein 12 n=1 Tax=Perkinsus chesapeaki TaxID=330153 RepID=A0A7J6L0T6_PERCH|nr:hypothetical protein FOL47_010720 [Perkinsus chesapeaki]
MAKKAGKGKKGKKKADAPIGVPIPSPAQFDNLDREYETLERILLEKSVEAEEMLRAARDDRVTMKEMEKELAETQHATFAVTSDVAREYKASQESLIQEINRLETFLTEQNEELDICNHEYQEMVRQKDDEIAVKEAAIEEIKQRMDDMTNEFADMMTDTLTILRRQLDTTVEQFNKSKAAKDTGGADNEENIQNNSTYLAKFKEFNVEQLTITNPS